MTDTTASTTGFDTILGAIAELLKTGASPDIRERLASIAAVHGGQVSLLADGSAVATLSGAGVAMDLVVQAARCALAGRAARRRSFAAVGPRRP